MTYRDENKLRNQNYCRFSFLIHAMLQNPKTRTEIHIDKSNQMHKVWAGKKQKIYRQATDQSTVVPCASG